MLLCDRGPCFTQVALLTKIKIELHKNVKVYIILAPAACAIIKCCVCFTIDWLQFVLDVRIPQPLLRLLSQNSFFFKSKNLILGGKSHNITAYIKQWEESCNFYLFKDK